MPIAIVNDAARCSPGALRLSDSVTFTSHAIEKEETEHKSEELC